MHGCKLTCRERRFNRIPLQVRDMFARVQRCETEAERDELRRLAWAAKKQWFQHTKLQLTATTIRQGRTVNRNSKLFGIKSIRDGNKLLGGLEGAKLVCEDFQSKWKTHEANKHECINDFLCAHGGASIDVLPAECTYAFEHARSIRKLDTAG